MGLNGQVLIVTGSGSGIGKETALQLANQGAIIVSADYDEDAAKETADAIIGHGGQATVVKADVSKPEQVEQMVNAAVEAFGTLNGIFNNAGIGNVKPLLEHDVETYHSVIDVNQHGVFYGISFAAKKMVELGVKGTIVNTASIYAYMVAIGSINYHAAKAAVVAMTKSAALELAPHNIRVVGIAPGFIDTPILGDDKAMKEKLANQHMRRKLIQPEKVASVATFLFSNEADAINGSVIPVDDGFLSFKE
ncbi:SDR family NAD(P)-dependent oxidoreductase [Aureibacillus halotolerans]|uniref:NAD(P)-dependent dehydrogenase (Short-subunit alcohol dehydrogenase family) n=1 Tax=Aureibacillus halotolerans TaxID=1508390 RepID=A0A4R6UHH6_9BACI|nr:SDR family NAD(P)-dependent oxidoreductase [Aureibacillus halotolerans]TDQ42604.1 NAD(P)-dependent dehydrogenase (short-subunit alcohol dehydrogenase family) [Aureibacillus halotolerans]